MRVQGRRIAVLIRHALARFASPSRLVLIVLCLLLLGMGLALLQSFEVEREARRQARQTGIVRTLLRDAMVAALDAETGQRGYLLSERGDYLAPYERGRVALPPLIDRLGTTLGAEITPAQEEALARLRIAAGGKLAELAETLALATSGRRDAAIERLRFNEDQRLMDEFRAAVSALIIEEERLFDLAFTRVEASETRTALLFAALAVAMVLLIAFSLSLERRAARAEADAEEAEALRIARQRSDLVARELNHRVKNLFAVVLSMVSLSARHETDAKRALGTLKERIHALARAHSVGQSQFAAESVDLSEVVAATLDAYRGDEGRLAASGPLVSLPVKSVTPLGLILHELATNAVKYGALGAPGGAVDLVWTTGEAERGSLVHLDWRERGGPPVTAGVQGFGTRMIVQAARQLDATFNFDWNPDGIRFVLIFPLQD